MATSTPISTPGPGSSTPAQGSPAPTPAETAEHSQKTAIFFSLSLTLFAVVGVVLFIRRCVRCPTAGAEIPADAIVDGRKHEFDSTDDCSSTTIGQHMGTSGPYGGINIIPYDYANLDDYKFVQTPTTPTPSSTPGLSPIRFGLFNPHLAHLAGFNFRKESCGSCQKNLHKHSREGVTKDLRYFCRNCRMLHRFDDAIDRSCNSLAHDTAGSTGSHLDKKAFYYTPSLIHLAIISANVKKKRKELQSFRSQDFATGSLHDTKSESNIARSQYSSNISVCDTQDIFSPSPRRKISDICTHSMDAAASANFPKRPDRTSVSSIYPPSGAFRQVGLSSRDLHQSCSYDQDYNSQLDLYSQSSMDYPSTSCLHSHRDSCSHENRSTSQTSESKPCFYLQESDVILSPNKLLSRLPHYASSSQDSSSFPTPMHCTDHSSREPMSPRVIEDTSRLHNAHASGYSHPTHRSTFSYELSGGEGTSTRSNSVASSVTSLHHSPSHGTTRPSSARCPLQQCGGYALRSSRESRESLLSLTHINRCGSVDYSGLAGSSQMSCRSVDQCQHHDPGGSSLWYSMTSVNTGTDEDCYDEEEEEEDDDDDDEAITVAEYSKERVSQVEARVLNANHDMLTHSSRKEQCEIELSCSKT